MSYAVLYYPVGGASYQSKVCVYILGPDNFEKSSCALINDYYDETLKKPYKWDTRMGKGMVGFIRNVYIWKTYKSLTHMYYTPRKNYPFKDKCSPFLD